MIKIIESESDDKKVESESYDNEGWGWGQWAEFESVERSPVCSALTSADFCVKSSETSSWARKWCLMLLRHDNEDIALDERWRQGAQSLCVCGGSLSPVCSPLTGALGQLPQEKLNIWRDGEMDPLVCIFITASLIQLFGGIFRTLLTQDMRRRLGEF